jgi:branched-chain amino acid transport system permease protein
MSLGHVAYLGLGAYGTGLLIVKAGFPSFAALFAAAALVALLTVPLGIASLRVRGASFVIVSIALVLILQLVFQSWASFTGGSRGLVVPRPFPDLLRPEHHEVFFYLFCGLLAAALLAWWVIDRSQFGLGLKAIREDEDKSAGARDADGGVQAGGPRGVGDVHGARRRPVRAVVRRPGPNLPVLDPHQRLHRVMALLGGVRHLFGPLIGAVIVGCAMEYFKTEYGSTHAASRHHRAAARAGGAVHARRCPLGCLRPRRPAAPRRAAFDPRCLSGGAGRAMIETVELTKTFGGVTAVDRASVGSVTAR